MDNNIVGTIIYVAVSMIIPNYIIANGACLADKDYVELANILHNGDNWPYGRCDAEHFKLPNTCDKDNNCMMIKVK